MASSSAANHSNSASSSSSMEAYAMYKELAESDAKDVGQVIDRRISKIYQRLKETDSNLKAMEKLMIHRKPSSGRNSSTVDGHHHDSRPVSYQRLTQSMQDLYDAKSPLQETVQSPQKSSTDRQFNVQMQLSNLENQQSKLHDAVETLNRNFETSSRGLQMNGDVGAGEQVKTSMEQLSRELQRMTRDLEMAKVASTDREKELKIRARKSTYSWRSKCESLLVDKKYLEDQLLKSRDQIQMSMRERDILHLQLDEIHSKLKTEVHQREELKMQLSESRDESVKKDDILHRFKKLYDDTRDELALLKAELDKLQISYQQVADEKTSLYKDKVTLEQKMKSQEENFQKELHQQTISSSQAELVKKLENENQILQQTLAEMQKNDGKTSVEMDSVLKSLEEKNTVLALKNEKVAGELDCLKSELQELKAKHDRVLKDYYAKSEECFSKAKRISRLEDSLKDSCKTLNYKEQDFKVHTLKALS